MDCTAFEHRRYRAVGDWRDTLRAGMLTQNNRKLQLRRPFFEAYETP